MRPALLQLRYGPELYIELLGSVTENYSLAIHAKVNQFYGTAGQPHQTCGLTRSHESISNNPDHLLHSSPSCIFNVIWIWSFLPWVKLNWKSNCRKNIGSSVRSIVVNGKKITFLLYLNEGRDMNSRSDLHYTDVSQVQTDKGKNIAANSRSQIQLHKKFWRKYCFVLCTRYGNLDTWKQFLKQGMR